MDKIVYCPYCGHVYTGWNSVNKLEGCCYFCKTKTDFAETENSKKYYLEKAEKLYGRGHHFLKFEHLAFEEEIVNNPLFDPEIRKIRDQRKKEINAETKKRLDYLDDVERLKNKPKCPTCQSTNIKKISALNRGTSVALFGLFSSKIGKSFECLNCGYKW